MLTEELLQGIVLGKFAMSSAISISVVIVCLEKYIDNDHQEIRRKEICASLISI